MAVAGRKRPTTEEKEPEYDRLAITLPRRLAQGVRGKAEAGKARSVSAYIARAIEEKLERDQLQELLAEMAREFGPPTPEEQAWADSILSRFQTERD